MNLTDELPASPAEPLADYEIVWLKEGTGIFEIDFQKYYFHDEKLLFLSPGQYVNVPDQSIKASRIKLIAEAQHRKLDKKFSTRVLFSHVIAVGSVQVKSELVDLLNAITDAERISKELPPSKKMEEQLLKTSVYTWLDQKPFGEQLTREEIDLIFDLKRLIDKHFVDRYRLEFYNEKLDIAHHQLAKIIKSALGKTPGELERNRIILEAKRLLVFSSKSAKEICYELGFDDPSYFSRFFKNYVGITARKFRSNYRNFKSEVFVYDLLELIESMYREEKSVSYYAERFNLAPKSLSSKVYKALGMSVSELISRKVITESRKLLETTDSQVNEIAWYLGFTEPSHFSHFFKNNTGCYPSEYRESQQ